METGLQGAKADFSWDGRYVAFHTIKATGFGYEIQIVDILRKTRRVLSVPGSALFPSWTRDGRLCFQHLNGEHRGFAIADRVLELPETALPSVPKRLDPARWEDVFPDVKSPTPPINLVLVWAPWSPHVPEAFQSMATLQMLFAQDTRLSVHLALAGGVSDHDVRLMWPRMPDHVDYFGMYPAGMQKALALNQTPTFLMFRQGLLVDKRLGTQSTHALRKWVEAIGVAIDFDTGDPRQPR